ncbi:MAG: hypothetical protein JNK15_03035 [Planctomycetes bacterium]|nr:hypothetical protein [Planctomycetota bacterium]
MVSERDLRRLGIGARNPAARRMLALLLHDVDHDAVEWIVTQAARQDGVELAPSTATTWLQDGSWRDLWTAELRRRAAASTEAMPRDRLEGLVACRVIADRCSLDQVAAEFQLARDEVRRLVVRGAVARGLTDQQVDELFGVAAPSSRRSAEAFAEARTRYAAATAAKPATAAPAARPTRDDLARIYAQAGRKAPAHVVEILTRERTTP